MKVIENTLRFEVETWDDPGEYPSNAGGRALPSYQYIDGSGSLVVDFEGEEGMADLEECVHDLVGSVVDVPRNASIRYDFNELPNGQVEVVPQWGEIH